MVGVNPRSVFSVHLAPHYKYFIMNKKRKKKQKNERVRRVWKMIAPLNNKRKSKGVKGTGDDANTNTNNRE